MSRFHVKQWRYRCSYAGMKRSSDPKDEPAAKSAKAKRRPRAGWVKAFRELAEAGDDALVWPEFANADDADLSW